MRFSLIETLIIVFGFTVLPSLSNAQQVVTECGSVIDGDAVLSADLDCSAQPSEAPAIQFSQAATLDLAGFSIFGPSASVGVVRCWKKCTVRGPGAIVGGRWGVIGFNPNKSLKRARVSVVVDGVTMQDQLLDAIEGKRVVVRNALIDNAGRSAIGGLATTRVENTTISNCCDTIQPNSGSVLGGPAISSRRTVRTDNVTLVGNARGGILGNMVRDRGSTVTGNQTDVADCATEPECADISSRRRPTLQGTTCGTSYQLPRRNTVSTGAIENWGRCTDD